MRSFVLHTLPFAVLAAACSLSIETRDGLAEFDRASSWYVPMEELRAAGDSRWNDIMEGRLQEAYGVDLDAFRRDAIAAVEAVVVEHPGERVAVITHGGVINAFVRHVLASTRSGIFTPHYTSVTRVLASRSGVRTLLSLNDIVHLRVRARCGTPTIS